MEKENIIDEQSEPTEKIPSRLHTVTPLSKYLAMALFIVLPFFGGWVGYTYAPVKIVEVEKIGIVENADSIELVQNEKLEDLNPKDYFPELTNLNKGDSLSEFVVDSIEFNTFRPGILDGHTALVKLTGTTSISGKVIIENSASEEGRTPGTPYYIAFEPLPAEFSKIPYIDGFTDRDENFFVAGLERHPTVLDIISTAGCSIDSNEWCAGLDRTKSEEIVITISGFNLYSQSLPSGVPYFPVTALVP